MDKLKEVNAKGKVASSSGVNLASRNSILSAWKLTLPTLVLIQLSAT
jgi:hypothetical protein